MATASARAVGTLISRMTSPENSPYSGRATSRVNPESIMRLSSMAESTNCAKGTMHALMVMGMEMRIIRLANVLWGMISASGACV